MTGRCPCKSGASARDPSTHNNQVRVYGRCYCYCPSRTCKENTLTHFLGLIVGPNVEGQLADELVSA